MRDLDDPLNAPVHAYVTRGLLPAEREWPRFANEFQFAHGVPMSQLSTHPDLGERLKRVAPEGADWGLVAGAFVLRAPNGVLFAMARGMHDLYVRAGDSPLAAIAGAEVVPELGADWHHLDAWKAAFSGKEALQLQRELCAAAFAHVMAFDEGHAKG